MIGPITQPEPCARCGRVIGDHTVDEWSVCLSDLHEHDLPFEAMSETDQTLDVVTAGGVAVKAGVHRSEIGSRSTLPLTRGVDDAPVPMADKYLVLSEEERAKGFVRPLRTTYVHDRALGGCGATTTMGLAIAETYARKPRFYGATFCVRCSMHRPVGEFTWIGDGGEKVGT
jgi:hypothetical protein